MWKVWVKTVDNSLIFRRKVCKKGQEKILGIGSWRGVHREIFLWITGLNGMHWVWPY